ncbi:MAG: DMT family transporter [Candidatus Poribacteria bacterium]|nr:DMT family transporter [Candidatus Poribacteria bacterium]MDE0505699.1 DMT family transporter [Candidatus Poribacteria bacterium]
MTTNTDFSFSLGELSALSGALLWAGSNLVLQTQSQKIPLLLANVARCATGTLLFWVMLPFDDPLTAFRQVPAHEWAAVFGSMIVGVCIGDTLFLVAIKEIGASHASAVGSIQPLTTLFFEWILLRSGVSWTLFVGSCFVVLGVICLSRAPRNAPKPADSIRSKRFTVGILLALLTALFWGLSTVLLKAGLTTLTPIQVNSVRLPFVTVILYTAWTLGSKKTGKPSMSSLLLIAGTGIFSMGFGSLLYLMALSKIGPSKTSALISTSPVFSLIMALVFLKEKISLRLALGVGLCVIGVWWVSI